MTILTTHVGSLPRSKKLSDLLFKKENNEIYDEDTFNKVVKDSVFDIEKESLFTIKRKAWEKIAEHQNAEN